MKRVVCIFLFLFFGLSAVAQDRIPQLDRARGRRVSFHYTYSLSRNGGAFTPVTEGEVVTEDAAYRLDGLGLEVVCDGFTRWTRDPDARELLIETVDRSKVMDNPGLLVTAYEQYASLLHVRGGTDTSLDVVLDLDEDMQARFVLTSLVYSEPKGKSDFSFDEKSLSRDYVVTDLR